MKKKTSKIAVLLMTAVLTFSMTACGNSSGGDAETDEPVTLKIGTEADMFPWTYMEDGNIVGFEADIMSEVGKRIGADIEMEAIEWESLYGSLDSERISSIASIVTITEERQEKYHFTQPYVYNPMMLATRADSDINSMEDIDGASIVVEVGSTDEIVLDYLETNLGVDLEPVYYEGISISDVENGRVDLWIGGLPSLNTMIESGYDLKIVGDTGTVQEYGYPFLKNENGEKLCKQFDDALTEMKEDGTLTDISKKWFDIDITQEGSAE